MAESRVASLTALTLRESEITQEQTDFIFGCLSDESEEVRSLAVGLILCSYYSADREIGALIEMLSTDTENIRCQIYDELAGCTDTEKISGSLKNAVLCEKSTKARYHAMTGWADNITNHAPTTRDFNDETAIINSISDTDDFIRLGRIYALYRFRQSDRLPEMLGLLSSRDTALKCEMVRLLAYGIDSEDIGTAVTAFKHHISSGAEDDVKNMIYLFCRRNGVTI